MKPVLLRPLTAWPRPLPPIMTFIGDAAFLAVYWLGLAATPGLEVHPARAARPDVLSPEMTDIMHAIRLVVSRPSLVENHLPLVANSDLSKHPILGVAIALVDRVLLFAQVVLVCAVFVLDVF